MVSSEEKKRLIEDMIKMSYQIIEPVELQRQLHNFLLRDTNEGKLYKYRSFDKDGYSLKNLQDETLHCSKADAFNDPFDCKIGVTFHSIYAAKYDTEFDVVCGILEKYLEVLHNDTQIEDCSVDEQRVINKLLSSDILNDFLMNNDDKAETEEELALLLKNNYFVVVELMQIVLSDEAFRDSLGICVDMLPRMLERISPEGMLLISSEDASIEDYARANGVVEDTDEVGLTMLLSQKLYPEHNGAVEDVQRLLDEMDSKLAEKMKNLFLVGCLCTSYKNRLMWSHYADSHKGFCIEYDFSEPEDEVLSKIPLPVFYSENRPLVPWKAVIDNSVENMEEAYAEIMMGLLTKDKEWEYENEWRILIGATEDSEFKMPRVSCIYLGAFIEKENRDKIIAIAKERNIPVKQMKVDRGAYDLHAEDVMLFTREDV
ncbi:MAG: DUF2971 domain-containing protein [Agathobacter sp.]|nr:DUF2971 domain-containing protein [Agathobacter sp.]